MTPAITPFARARRSPERDRPVARRAPAGEVEDGRALPSSTTRTSTTPDAQDAQDRQRLLDLADDRHDGLDPAQVVDRQGDEALAVRRGDHAAVDVDVVAEDVADGARLAEPAISSSERQPLRTIVQSSSTLPMPTSATSAAAPARSAWAIASWRRNRSRTSASST